MASGLMYSGAFDALCEAAHPRSLGKRIKDLIKGSALEKFHRVGWLDEDLDLTEEGKDAVIEMLFEKNTSELEKIADDLIAEEEAE